MNCAVVESVKGWKVDHSVTCNRTNMPCKHKDIVRCQNERWVVYFKNEDVQQIMIIHLRVLCKLLESFSPSHAFENPSYRPPTSLIRTLAPVLLLDDRHGLTIDKYREFGRMRRTKLMCHIIRDLNIIPVESDLRIFLDHFDQSRCNSLALGTPACDSLKDCYSIGHQCFRVFTTILDICQDWFWSRRSS